MKKEVQDVVNQFQITIADSVEKATEILDKASDKLYSCIVTGKLTKAGSDKYYAVCTLKTQLTDKQKSELAVLYLETVVLHAVIREQITPKTVSGTNSKKRKGMF